MSDVGFELEVFLRERTDTRSWLDAYVLMIESHGVYTGGRGPAPGIPLTHYVSGDKVTDDVRNKIVA